MRDVTVKAKTFFSKSYNSDNEIPYAWYNTNELLNKEQIDSIFNYFNQHQEIDKMIIVNNIISTRPQRTWGNFPEFFRPSGQLNTFPQEDKYNNSFILMIYDTYDKKDIEEGLSTFPKYSEILKFYK